MALITRPVSWIKAARKDFEDFPSPVKIEAQRVLTVAAGGHIADHVKALKGLDSGVMEIVLRHRGDFSCCLCRSNRRRVMGDTCLSEKIHARH